VLNVRVVVMCLHVKKTRQFINELENREGPTASVSPKLQLNHLTCDGLQVCSSHLVAYCIITAP